MEKILFIPLIVSFFSCFILLPIWIRRAKKAGLCGRDMHKLHREDVAEAGGVSMVVGFILGVLSYIFIKTFYLQNTDNLVEILAMLVSILIISFIGFTDDILGWKIGLNKRIRIIMLIFASIPLAVISAGDSNVMGIELGLLFPLVILPIGIVGSAATYNFLAGYNGLEASQGIIIFAGLALVTFLNGTSWLSLICLIMSLSLIAFLIFNKYPAKVFPGDVLTYSVGGLIGIVAILGNIEKIAIFFFIPYILETLLKLRGKLKKESFAKLNSDGSLDVPYDKFYGLEHISLSILKRYFGRASERGVVILINLFQIIVIILSIAIFWRNI